MHRTISPFFRHITGFCALLTISAALTAADVRSVNDLDQLPNFRKNPERRGEIAVAKRSFPYAIAAERAYERNENEFEPIPFPDESKWKLVSNSNPQEARLGFYAKAWVHTQASGENEVVIAFRGTQFSEIPDWTRGNLTTLRLFPWRTQYDAALDYVRDTLRNPECAGLRLVLTGHSLGGGLAEYCQRFIKGSIAIVFAPSPNQGRIFSIGAGGVLPDKDVLRVFENGEILRYLRWFALVFNRVNDDGIVRGQSARWLNFTQKGVIGDHAMGPFANNLVRLSALHFNEDARRVLNQIADRRVADSPQVPVDRWWNRDLVSNWTRGNGGDRNNR